MAIEIKEELDKVVIGKEEKQAVVVAKPVLNYREFGMKKTGGWI